MFFQSFHSLSSSSHQHKQLADFFIRLMFRFCLCAGIFLSSDFCLLSKVICAVNRRIIQQFRSAAVESHLQSEAKGLRIHYHKLTLWRSSIYWNCMFPFKFIYPSDWNLSAFHFIGTFCQRLYMRFVVSFADLWSKDCSARKKKWRIPGMHLNSIIVQLIIPLKWFFFSIETST